MHPRCTTFAILIAVSTLAPRLARADDARAKLTCAVDSEPKPIAAGKPTAMGKELHCTLTLGPKSAELAQGQASAWITSAGQHEAPRKVAGSVSAEGDKTFFQLDALQRAADFKGCVDFVVHAEITGDKPWSGTLPIKTKCPALKKLDEKLSCSYTAQDGTIVKWPGNGGKLRPRLTEASGLVCSLDGKDKNADGVETVWMLAGKAASAKPSQIRCMAADCSDSVAFMPPDYDECENLSVEVVAGDADGRQSLHLTQKIVQFCPD